MIRPKIRGISPAKRSLWDRVLEGRNGCCYVLGRNKYANSVAELVPVAAFIDDYTDEKSYCGRPVVRMNQLPHGSPVISCVVDARALTAVTRLEAAGASEVLTYYDVVRLDPSRFLGIDYCSENQSDIDQNWHKYEQIHARLADESSKRAFAQVVGFRRTLDLENMRGLSWALDRQYFEPFLALHPGEVFVDGGAYDGGTTLRFAAVCQNYKRIHCFEPSPEALARLRQNVRGLAGVEIIEKGLSNRHGRVGFNAAAGSANHISDTGTIEIDVGRLDDEVLDPITFLKLDVEGAEYKALEGTHRHIATETPILAVCVYHNQRDFWQIPELVLNINPSYRVFFRHYTEGILESVMFFVPPTRMESPKK